MILSARLLQESVENEGHPPISYDEAYDYLRSDRFTGDNGAVFTAFKNGVAAGIVCGEWHRDVPVPFFEVHNLFVYAEFRGIDVATKLIKAVIAWTGTVDAPVYITTKGEPRAFYESLGFSSTHRICTSTLQAVRDRLG